MVINPGILKIISITKLRSSFVEPDIYFIQSQEPNITKLRSEACEMLRKKSLLCQTDGLARLTTEQRKDKCSDEIEKYKDCLKGNVSTSIFSCWIAPGELIFFFFFFTLLV
mgnify:FL=1